MLRLAGPVVLAELGWMSMGVVDTIMVAPLGPAAIGATGIGNALHIALAIFGMGLLLGLDTLVSQAFGAGRIAECHRWLVHAIVLGCAVSIPLTALCAILLLTVPFLGFHPLVMPLLQGYFAIVLWSTLPLLMYAALRRYLQGMHAVAPIAFALVSANLLNAVANWALIYGHLGLPALGVPGSAGATVVSRVYLVVVLALAVALIDRGRRSGLRHAPRRIEWARLSRLVRLGFPAAVQVTLEVGVFAVATVLAGRLDPVSSASHQIALNVASVAFMIPLGIASAAAVRVGHAVGARDPVAARAAGWAAILIGGIAMTLTGLLLLTVPETFIELFTVDPRVLVVGSSLLLVAAAFQLFDGAQVVATGALRGLGDTRTPMLANLAGHWLIGLPIGYSLCFWLGFGVLGLWVGLSLGLVLVGIFLLWVWHRSVTRLAGHMAAVGQPGAPPDESRT